MTDDADRPDPVPADELLIDIGTERVIRAKIAELAPQLRVVGVDSDHRLGLTRLALADVASALAGLAARPGTAEAVARLRAQGSSAHLPAHPLDVLVAVLREWSAERPAGPLTVDRTHEVSAVSSLPHVKSTVAVLAEPVDPLAGDRVPPGRPVGPRIGIADARPFAHPDLAGRLVGEPLISAGPFPSRLPGHATFVAGTVLRRAPSAVLVCRTVLEPSGSVPNTVWDVARRLVGFLDDDVAVLNLSFACRTDGFRPLPLLRAAQLLAARGTVLVAAGGNTGDEAESDPAYPAAFDEVLAVGAATDDGEPAAFTPDASWLDLLAPGDGVVGPFLVGQVDAPDQVGCFPSGYAAWSGSSFAAAAVSGELARLMIERDLTAPAARDVLLAGAVGDVRSLRPVQG